MKIIHPKNEQEWLEMKTHDITSTEVSALFGISPYTTAFELYHRKKAGNMVRIEDNERMCWGRRLQDAIAFGVAVDNKWIIRRMDEYIRDPALRIGSSFDFSVEENGILEIKNVAGHVFHNEWDEENAPLHIEIQVQHQLLVSGRAFAYIGALVGGNHLVLLKRTPDQKVFSAIKEKVSEFWKSIEDGVEPKPNMEVDAGFIASLYGYAEPGKVIHIEDPHIKVLALKYKEEGNRIKSAESIRETIKAHIFMAIGNAEKALGDGFSISAGTVGPCHVEFDKKGFRMFKINSKEEK